jgi:hypothetical protein
MSKLAVTGRGHPHSASAASPINSTRSIPTGLRSISLESARLARRTPCSGMRSARHRLVCPYGPHDPLEWNHCQPTRVEIIFADYPLRQTVPADGPISGGAVLNPIQTTHSRRVDPSGLS